MSKTLFILYESASGYALFERTAADEIALDADQVQTAVGDVSKFGKMIKLTAFAPFKSAQHALENINDVSEGVVHEHLRAFLELNVAASKTVQLGMAEKNLAGSVKAALGIDCVCSDLVLELLRGIRAHFAKLVAALKVSDDKKAQLGLGHSYSRAKVKFNVNRADNMIIQSICLLDQLDKDINTFSMRVREWYGWHFPELVRIVADNNMYARLVKLIKNKASLVDASIPALEDLVSDASIAKQVLDAARSSMGTDISEIDMINIQSFADRVISLFDYRKSLFSYLNDKMHNVAPNLSALIGEVVGARLISHAGSLTNLAKYPASTVQILGAEKALFRALKTKGNTPKYGLIYHSSFIGRAGQKNKGRISRFLANKCSIASRIDCFLDERTSVFGEAMKQQVEDRLKFFEEGSVPRKNAEVMKEALNLLTHDDDEIKLETPTKKRKAADTEEAPETEGKKSKKDKKDKKSKKTKDVEPEVEPEIEPVVVVEPVAESSPAKKEKKEKKDKKEKKSKK